MVDITKDFMMMVAKEAFDAAVRNENCVRGVDEHGNPFIQVPIDDMIYELKQIAKRDEDGTQE